MLDIAGTWLTAEDRQLLRQPEVGGLILFARNIENLRQVEDLCRAIRAVRPDILLAVDQEGGACSACGATSFDCRRCVSSLRVPMRRRWLKHAAG